MSIYCFPSLADPHRFICFGIKEIALKIHKGLNVLFNLVTMVALNIKVFLHMQRSLNAC